MAASNYFFQVTAGPAYDCSTHRLVRVNSPTPLFISHPHADVNLSVKIRNYRGLPHDSPATSDYFSHPSRLHDQYSISFAILPKKPIRGDNLVFGNDFDHPVRERLPPGFNAAFNVVKWFIDPGLEGDAYSDNPYLYGPALSSLTVLRVGERRKKLPEWQNEVLEEGGEERGEVPEDGRARRRWFLRREERKNWVFEDGRVYWADFYNGYLDFNELTLRLPGFNFPALKYLDRHQKTIHPHKLRYVLKNRETGDVYFVVVFTLLRKDGGDGGDVGAFMSDSDDEAMSVDGEKSSSVEFVPSEDDID